MDIIIYGAGGTGADALSVLGDRRVKCFVATKPRKTELYGIEVISIEALEKLDLTETIVVIASIYYWPEMEKRLLEIPGVKYFIFRPNEYYRCEKPNYYLHRRCEAVSYGRLLAHHKIDQYKRIAILGATELLPYLITEIAVQHSYESIVEVISDGKEHGHVTPQSIGIPVVTWEEADKGFDCLIVNLDRARGNVSGVLDQLDGKAAVIDLYNDADIVEPAFYHSELSVFKDIHKGKRIFLIGNGPSLRFEDLEKLRENGEICIGFNTVYRAYDRTKWRADYLFIYDTLAIENCWEDFGHLPGILIVGDSYNYRDIEKRSSKVTYYCHIIDPDALYAPNLPGFSDDVTRGVYEGHTVTYTMGMQFAAYMGASEIYLLGVDHNFTVNIHNDHFFPNYMTEDEERKFIQKRDYSQESIDFYLALQNASYQAAEQYSRKHGFRIYNATRGGKLEVFERVDFDSLWN